MVCFLIKKNVKLVIVSQARHLASCATVCFFFFMNIAKNRLLSQEVAICLADGQPQACLQPCQIISFTHSFNNFIMGLKKNKQTLFQSSDYRLLQNAQWVEWGVYSEIWRANQLSRFWSLQPEKCTKCTKGFVSETDGKKVLLRMCVISHRGEKKKKNEDLLHILWKNLPPPPPKWRTSVGVIFSFLDETAVNSCVPLKVFGLWAL